MKFFAGNGYKVFAFSRKQPHDLPADAVYIKYDLEEQITEEESVFAEADYLVHCAYSQFSTENPESDKVNIEGTSRLLALSRKYKFKKIIFLSSLSAHSEARSHYGKTKLFLESLFDTKSDLILKPGMVLGNGGLFKSIEEIIIKNKFIPVIGNGKQPVQSIDIDDLAEIIKIGIEKNISGVYPAAGPEVFVMKELYKAVSAHAGKSNVFVPFPYWCAFLLIFLAKMVNIKLPISKENIIGLKHNKKYDVIKTLNTFGIRFINYKESLNKLVNI